MEDKAAQSSRRRARNDSITTGHDTHVLLEDNHYSNMKRFRDEGADFSESEDDAFDDGDDLMARAAEMMDFDDEEDSGSNSDSASEAEAPQNKRQKPNGRKKSASPADEALQDDLEAVNILQLQVRPNFLRAEEAY